jgi:glycosyltransferase involved in cell wall biosynthesis
MKILFLDQTGKLAGAEMVLLDVAAPYRFDCLVGLFEDGLFREKLEAASIPVQVLAKQAIAVRRESGLIQGLSSIGTLLPLVYQVAALSHSYDVIYANTLKAFVVGAIASLLSRRPLVFHLHDILIPEHFSTMNRRLVVTLANTFASQVITVSHAARDAFIAAGGNPNIIQVIYNGFEPSKFTGFEDQREAVRRSLGLEDCFLVGHFSRLSAWKGQHVLLEALAQCPEQVHGLFVGDALFGETDYAQMLQRRVVELGLQDRAHFLGFRSDVPQLMAACDVITHTATLPEPCARVLVETMLSGKTLIASANGGTVELLDSGRTGWLVKPTDAIQLAETIQHCANHPEQTMQIGQNARQEAVKRFHIKQMHQEIYHLLCSRFGEPNSLPSFT